ncbi:MAG: hypothetical protein VKL59_26800 [Nostocaceae cyanobacterium]|nr:hypothetical protein [Nostocaceae cyanobacterium]
MSCKSLPKGERRQGAGGHGYLDSKNRLAHTRLLVSGVGFLSFPLLYALQWDVKLSVSEQSEESATIIIQR